MAEVLPSRIEHRVTMGQEHVTLAHLQELIATATYAGLSMESQVYVQNYDQYDTNRFSLYAVEGKAK